MLILRWEKLRIIYLFSDWDSSILESIDCFSAGRQPIHGALHELRREKRSFAFGKVASTECMKTT